jgi:predicted site-specific integrase-resolvase
MPSSRGFSLLLTARQAADRLGVPVGTVLHWVATGRLRIAGQDEDGRALFREGAIESLGDDFTKVTAAPGSHE